MTISCSDCRRIVVGLSSDYRRNVVGMSSNRLSIGGSNSRGFR